jgi:hypothetical protein
MARVLRTARIIAALFVATLALAGTAHAAGGNYVFDGGTQAEQGQVRKALNASAFDWNRVPAQITVHIAPGISSEASRGELWLDAGLLDTGIFSWGIVQHEYAHQVDFFLLSDPLRATLAPRLGGTSWWQAADEGIAHASLTSERFASTLAWSYWPNSRNVLKPQATTDESAAMAPAKFRALLAATIGAPDTLSAKRTPSGRR